MKAAVYAKAKAGKVLEIADIGKPVAQAGEVLMRVHAASVNPLDWRLKSRRPGVDVAGVVEAVAEGVTEFKPGDAVFGTGRGAFAEYACAPAAKLAAKPEAVTFEQAAAIPIAGLTALQGIRDVGRVRAGQRVLVIGAAGGVGTFAVQLARHFGAQVTGVCSSRNVEQSRTLGADRVIDYTKENLSAGGQTYDVIMDNVGSQPLGAIRAVMSPKGRCVMVGAPKTIGSVLRRLLGSFERRLLGQRFQFFVARANRKDLALLGSLVAEGKLRVVIDRQYAFANAAEAIAYVEGGHAPGKVVIGFGS